jgi:serine protease Do
MTIQFQEVAMSKRQKRLIPVIALTVPALVLIAVLSLNASGSTRVSDSEILLDEREEISLSSINVLEVLQNAYREVAQNVLPVVVQIDVTDVITQPVPEFQSPFDFFFGPQREDAPDEREFRRFGLGSGVIVRRSGSRVYVLTNNHVVGDADEIVVTLYDKRRFTARLVGKDPRIDLALVEFDTKEDVPVAVLGNSDTTEVGDLTFAVGSPLGFESTITSGIVSAVGRKPVQGSGIGGFTDYIQTDAAINRGNSGGPLVNIYGEVIGINTWISSPNGGSIGLGFTIPINNAKRVIDDFIAKGSVDYGWLGINMGDPAENLKQDMQIQDMNGAFVYDVFRGSPADSAGILPGDYITHINGEALNDSASLMYAVANLKVGKIATFDIVRYGRKLQLQVKIAARSDEEKIQQQRRNLWPGISVVKITEEIQKQLDMSKRMGDLIIGNVASDGPAGVAGLRTGDVIKEVNGKSVKSVMDFYRTLNDNESNELVFRIYRQGTELLLGLIKG